MWFTIQAFGEELFRIAVGWLRRRPAVAALASVVGFVIAIRILLLLASLLMGSTRADPNAYREVYGRVSYEDGTLVSATSLVLSFIPDVPSSGSPTGLRTGTVLVDSRTGKFASRLGYRKDAGTVGTQYRVCVLAAPQVPLDKDIARPEYSDPQKTPVRVDVKQQPLDIKISRPSTAR